MSQMEKPVACKTSASESPQSTSTSPPGYCDLTQDQCALDYPARALVPTLSPEQSFYTCHQDAEEQQPRSSRDGETHASPRSTRGFELQDLTPSPTHHGAGLLRQRPGPGSRTTTSYTLRPRLVRAQSQLEVLEEEEHARHGYKYYRYKLVARPRKWSDPLLLWWEHYIAPHAEIISRRDHLAVERTYLEYFRTASQLAMHGVTIMQLYTLEKVVGTDPVFGYHVVGKPLAMALFVAAIIIILVGTYRLLKQQEAIGRGKIWAGVGWESCLFTGLGTLLSVGLLVIEIVIAVRRGVKPDY